MFCIILGVINTKANSNVISAHLRRLTEEFYLEWKRLVRIFAFFSTSKDGDGVISECKEEEDVVVVHVHFGMSGAWAVFDTALGEEEPEVKPTTRLRLEEIVAVDDSNHSAKRQAATAASATTINNGKRFITHLSAMTVTHGPPTLFTTKKSSLGQDPLRSDANPTILYNKIIKSKKSIGQLLMDQSYFAGPGNIYRAEILFLSGIYPTTVGNELDRASFDTIWNVCVKLLRRGYDTGSILTVDAELDPIVAARGERRYIYNKSACARCGNKVSSWDMSGRTCYACEGGVCQPKKVNIEKGELLTSCSAGRGKAVKTKQTKTLTKEDEDQVLAKEKAKKKGKEKRQENTKQKPQQHVPFISHCARIPHRQRLEQGGAECLTIAEIRSVMKQILMDYGSNGSSDNDVVAEDTLPPKSARKAVHVMALNNLLLEQQQREKSAVKKEDDVKSMATSKSLPPPLISAEDAAREKANNGENRAVEHIAELSRGQAIKAIESSANTTTKTPSQSSKMLSATDGEESVPRNRRQHNKKNPNGKRDGTLNLAVKSGSNGCTGRRSSRRRLRYDA